MSAGRVLPPLAGGAAAQLVVLLHGYGSNGADMIGLAPSWRQALPHAAFVAPDAPERCVGAPGGYQWWGLQSLDRSALAAGVRRAGPALDARLDALLTEHGVAPERLLLVGFSQGTMMALHVGLRRRCAGVIGYSGLFADSAAPPADAPARPPVLLVHGAADDVAPVAALHDAEAHLRRLGCAVEAHVSAGLGHGVDPAGLALGKRFAVRVLG